VAEALQLPSEPMPPDNLTSVAPWQLASSSALVTALMSVVGATAPDLRGFLGVSTAALTLAFIGQMFGALLGARITRRERHRLLELCPLALLAAAAVTAAAFAPTPRTNPSAELCMERPRTNASSECLWECSSSEGWAWEWVNVSAKNRPAKPPRKPTTAALCAISRLSGNRSPKARARRMPAAAAVA
jgi:hypothetical protein